MTNDVAGWLSRAVAGDVISSDSYLPTEYCWQSFNASCPFHNQVVMVTAARYGRMRLGQCVTRDYYLKCSADVITQVDKRCSGRRSCEFYVPDTTLQHLQPCPKDLMAYLEADYTCITGMTVAIFATCVLVRYLFKSVVDSPLC